MKLAIRQCDITPDRPCWQGGYVQREAFYERVHDPIKATIYVLTIQNKKQVWVSMDVSGVNDEVTTLILNRVQSLGISLNHQEVIFGATHTHSGPNLTSHHNKTVDEEYLEKLVFTVSTQIVDAMKDAGEEVSVKIRKTWIDGLYSNRNDANKHSDKWVVELGFFNQEKMIGLLFTMAHHCTVLGPNFMELSADLFGEIRRLLQEENNVPVLMVQGNAGDMGNKQYRKSNLFDEVEKEAYNLVDQMHKKGCVWQDLSILEWKISEGSYLAQYDVDIHQFEVKKAEFERQLENEKNFDTIKLLVTGISSFERKIKQGNRHVEKEMPYRILTMNDLQIVSVPGELGSILGMRIKAASKAKHCLVWAYANPCDLGYMIEKEAYGGFSQESNVTDYPSGIPDEYVACIIRNLDR